MLKLLKQTSFLVILGILAVIFFPGYAKIQELRHKNKELETSINQLAKENESLKAEKLRLEKDPDYLERVGRERLGVVKKGETVYKIVTEEKQ